MSEKNNIDHDLNDSIDYGVMKDKLNIGKIVFWSLLGIVILVVMIFGVNALYNYNKFLVMESSSTQQEFRDIQKLRNAANERLNTAGVVDLENNTYHIPIEEAISIYLNDAEN